MELLFILLGLHSKVQRENFLKSIYLLSHRVLMCLCGHFVGVQFGWHDGDEVLKDVISWG